MRKSHFKILLTLLVASLLLVSVFTINIFAKDEYVEITYAHGDAFERVPVVAGKEITLPTPESKLDAKVYGWFDGEGNFYNCGEKITPTKNLTLYCADGGEIALSGSLALSTYKGYSYIKLKSNISIDSSITLPDNQVLYLDLNGNSINITTNAIYNEDASEEMPHGAFVGADSGIIFANSSSEKATVNHTAGGSPAFALNSLVSLSPIGTPKCLTFVVKENVSITENMNLFSVQTNISNVSGAINVSIYGEVECERLLRTNGISQATVTIYDSATLVSTGEHLFEDITTANDLLTLTIYGGTIDLSGTGFIRDASRISSYVYGGSFSKDIASYFPNGNFIFELNSAGRYDFKECKHEGPLAEHAYICKGPCELDHEHCPTLCEREHEHCQCVLDHTHYYNCTDARELNHLCIYCNSEFPVSYPNGVDHSLRMELVQEPVNTVEETKAGSYRTYCTRCDYSRTENAFPDPSTVYITVKFTEGEGIREIRVPAEDLFSFDETVKTKIISYSADSVFYYDDLGNKVSVAAESVFYVEVPLGTTEIYGEMRNANNTPTKTGVFLGDAYLKEIALPESIENISSYAFLNMPNLEKITGIEYITGSIGTEAFMQETTSKLVIEHMILNASSVSEYAFKNVQISTLTIGESVSKISNYAFALDDAFANSPDFKKIVEIFVEGNKTVDGVKLGTVKDSMGSNHQFSDKAIVFLDHDYLTTNKAATCIEYGHDFHECQRCFKTYTDNYIEQYAEHDLVEHIVPSTCQTYGFEGVRCTVCDIKIKYKDLPIDKDNHTYAAGFVKRPLDPNGWFCVDPYYTLRKCGCGAIEEDIPENWVEIVEPPIDAKHNFKEDVITEATCGDYGKTRFTCKDCKYQYDQIIPPTGQHKYTNENKVVLVAATCATPETGYYSCTTCSATVPYTLEGVFDVSNHTKTPGDQGTIVSEPSSEYAGLKSFICKDCGMTFTEEIPKVDDSIIIKIPFTDKEWFRTDQETINTALIIVFVSIPLIAGIILTFVFTFGKKKSKSAGYKFRFNTLKKDGGSNKSVSEQLAEMNLTEELPPDVPITEGGERDDAAAWTAYVDAINNDYERTVELNLQNAENEKTEQAEAVSQEDAWKAYVEALNRDYEQTMEINLKEEGKEEKSFADMMEDTVFDFPTDGQQSEDTAGEPDTSSEQASDDEDDEKLTL
ncbi:MAG: leucine-rich repeat protein [Clostridia bacterium]|nr:leucine-rich repeat protein [Clostridia bacterium]